MEITKEDYQAFLRNPVYIKYCQFLQDQIDHMADVQNSAISQSTVEYNLYANSLTGLEQLGMDTLARMAAIRGIDYALNEDAFAEYCFGEVYDAES